MSLLFFLSFFIFLSAIAAAQRQNHIHLLQQEEMLAAEKSMLLVYEQPRVSYVNTPQAGQERFVRTCIHTRIDKVLVEQVHKKFWCELLESQLPEDLMQFANQLLASIDPKDADLVNKLNGGMEKILQTYEQKYIGKE